MRGQGERGFTLLEALVTFVIVAASLQVAFQVFATQRANYEIGAAQSKAALLAQSVLTRIGREIPLAPGRSAGELEDGYRYETLMEPFPLGDTLSASESVGLYAIRLKVFREKRVFAVETLRIRSGKTP